MQEKENVIRILKETREAIDKKDSFKLRDLSDQTVHTSSVYQDSDNILVAVIVYSLGKIVERRKYAQNPGYEKFIGKVITNIKNASLALEKNNEEGCRNYLVLIRDSITKMSDGLKDEIRDVFRKAEINKASKIYEHGISMEKTAKLLGISLWELAEYAGAKSAYDPRITNLSRTINEKQRLKNALEIFK